MAGSKILVIDADSASRSYVTTVLSEQGYEVLQVSSAKEGLIAAWRDHPDLILADPVTADLPGEELAARLRSDSRTSKVPLIALSSDTQPNRMQACIEAGFDDYLVKSSEAMPALIERMGKLLDRGKAARKPGGSLIAFLSAKGGTGTSSLCANLAMTLAENQPQAQMVVADLVLPIGSIGGIVGYEGSQNLVTIANMPPSKTTPQFLGKSLERMSAWRFHLLAGSPDPAQAIELEVGRIGQIVNGLRSAYDAVVLDLGRSLSRISLPLIERADLVVMIVSVDMTTVSLSKTVWRYLQSRGVEPSSVYAILNRAVGLEGVTRAQAEKIIGLPIQAAVPYLAENFSLANNQHQPYCVKFPNDTASLVLRDTARQMARLAITLRPG
jgi:pilus assembly protein CpaE